jgi:hypothetical protein
MACVKKGYTRIAAQREIDRFQKLAEQSGIPGVAREMDYCGQCDQWHISYPNSRKRPELGDREKRELRKIQREPFLEIGLQVLGDSFQKSKRRRR